MEQLKLVALRKESVDRNHAMQIVIIIMHASLSARRAWIEMLKSKRATRRNAVALRKESVDRNPTGCTMKLPTMASLSARRAWIEIGERKDLFRRGKGRSPQGERG